MKKMTDFVFDREGNAVVGAEVYVRLQSDNTLASLYSDDGITATANPCVTDNDGEFSFYTADNELKLQVYVDAVQQNEINHVLHYDVSAFGMTLVDDATAGAALTTLGVSAYAQTILDDANAAASRTTLGVVIGTDVQAYDADLGAIAALTSAANKVPYSTGAQAWALADLTAFGRSLTALADNAALRALIGAPLAYKGALVTKAADQNTADYQSLITAIAWDSENSDTDAFHDNVTNNTRLTIPAGVSRVKLKTNVYVENITAAKQVFVTVRKNGSATGYPGQPTQSGYSAAFVGVGCESGIINVTAGDYFEVFMLIETDNSVSVRKDTSWFSIEVIE